MNAQSKADFVLSRLNAELDVTITLEETDTNRYQFIAGQRVRLGETTLRVEVDSSYGDILFGSLSGLFMARDVSEVLKRIENEYKETFGK